MSIKKSGSLYATCKVVAKAIHNGELNLALQLIHDLVERIITEPLCTGHVYGSKELDDLCQTIGECNLSGNCPRHPERREGSPADGTVFVYIVTKVQKSGGHSRVIERFITARPEAKHLILATGLNGKSDFACRLSELSKITDVILETAPSGNFQQKLTWLQKRLIEIQPEQTYLFNDHQDSIAIAAIQPSMGLNASFYHHADHHLCLGVFSSHLHEHIDIHPMGYHHCRETLGVKNRYLPLTIDDKGMRSTNLPFKQNDYLTTCTAARANKIESPYYISYLAVIPLLLQSTGGKHVHIGRLTPWALFKLRRSLKKHGIASDRFVYTPWVPSVWTALHDFNVDLYITSFPYGGGLTLIEAMGAGVPVALHRHIYSRVLSGIDLAYPEAFIWQDPDALIEYCCTVTADELLKHGEIARRQYENFYDRDIFDGLINQKIDSLEPGQLPEYPQKSDEWACWMENQLTLSKLIMRTAYRSYRRIRRRLARSH